MFLNELLLAYQLNVSEKIFLAMLYTGKNLMMFLTRSSPPKLLSYKV